MLKVKNIESGYGPMQVLWQPSLEVKKGSITSLLGPNGVGKSTLLATIFGSVHPWKGEVYYNGEEVTKMPTHKKVEMGILENRWPSFVVKRRRAPTSFSSHLNVVFKGEFLPYLKSPFVDIFGTWGDSAHQCSFQSLI